MEAPTKICWQCRVEAPLYASVCPSCRARLGNRKTNGLASRRLGPLAWISLGCGGFLAVGVIVPLIFATMGVMSRVERQAASGMSYAKGAESKDPSAEEVKAAQVRFAKLRPSFIREVDKFSQGILWRNKAFSKYINGNGTTLVADIWNGSIRLQASYQGHDWIFFKDVTVKGAGTTAEVHGDPQHHVQDGVTEYLRIRSDDAVPILALIKAAGDGPVDVRLDGKFVKDFALKPAHKKAIQDTITFMTDLDLLRTARKVPAEVN